VLYELDAEQDNDSLSLSQQSQLSLCPDAAFVFCIGTNHECMAIISEIFRNFCKNSWIDILSSCLGAVSQ